MKSSLIPRKVRMYKTQIERYHPVNEQEKKDKQLMLAFIEKHDDVLLRDNLAAHLTSSAIVVNETLDKVLFAHHNIYDAWGWVGGHNDGNPDLLAVALKEAKEETGVTRIEPYTDAILGLDVIQVQNHRKNGAYIPDHLHLNVTFLLVADEQDKPVHKPDENAAVRWFDIDTVLNHVSEKRMHAIYKKLFSKVKGLKENQTGS